MKITKYIIVLQIFSLNCAENVSNQARSLIPEYAQNIRYGINVQPESSDYDNYEPKEIKQGYYFNKKRGYFDASTGKTIQIGLKDFKYKPLSFKVILIKLLKDGSLDKNFGKNGKVEVPTQSNPKDLQLRYNPYSGSIFVIDYDKSDVILFDKRGRIIKVISKKLTNTNNREHISNLRGEASLFLFDRLRALNSQNAVNNQSARPNSAQNRFLNQVRLNQAHRARELLNAGLIPSPLDNMPVFQLDSNVQVANEMEQLD